MAAGTCRTRTWHPCRRRGEEAAVVAAGAAGQSLPVQAAQGERLGLARGEGDGVQRRLQTQHPRGRVSSADGQGTLHHEGGGAAAGRGAHLRCGEPRARSVS